MAGNWDAVSPVTPVVALLDEPTEGLQPSIVQEIEDLIRQLQERRRTSALLVEQSWILR